MDKGDTRKAVTLFSHVYTTAEQWEEQIQRFIQLNQLEVNEYFVCLFVRKGNRLRF